MRSTANAQISAALNRWEVLTPEFATRTVLALAGNFGIHAEVESGEDALPLFVPHVI